MSSRENLLHFQAESHELKKTRWVPGKPPLFQQRHPGSPSFHGFNHTSHGFNQHPFRLSCFFLSGKNLNIFYLHQENPRHPLFQLLLGEDNFLRWQGKKIRPPIYPQVPGVTRPLVYLPRSYHHTSFTKKTAPFAESALETVTRHGRSICTRTLPGTQKKRRSLWRLRLRLSSFPGWHWGSWHQHYPSTLVTCLKLTPTIGSFRSWMLIICVHCIPSCNHWFHLFFLWNFYEETMETLRKSAGSHGGSCIGDYSVITPPFSGHSSSFEVILGGFMFLHQPFRGGKWEPQHLAFLTNSGLWRSPSFCLSFAQVQMLELVGMSNLNLMSSMPGAHETCSPHVRLRAPLMYTNQPIIFRPDSIPTDIVTTCVFPQK